MATSNGDVSFDSIPDAIEAFGELEQADCQHRALLMLHSTRGLHTGHGLYGARERRGSDHRRARLHACQSRLPRALLLGLSVRAHCACLGSTIRAAADGDSQLGPESNGIHHHDRCSRWSDNGHQRSRSQSDMPTTGRSSSAERLVSQARPHRPAAGSGGRRESACWPH